MVLFSCHSLNSDLHSGAVISFHMLPRQLPLKNDGEGLAHHKVAMLMTDDDIKSILWDFLENTQVC